MSDALPQSVRTQLEDPFAELTGPLAAARRLAFKVVESELISPSMQRIQLTAPELAGFRYEPGQDVMLLVAAEGRRPVRRRYTIRSLDRDTQSLTLNIVRHGDGPGERWLRADLFRIGASSLLTDIERQLEHFVTGRYAAAHRHPMV